MTLWNYPDGELKFIEESEILPRIEEFIRNFSPDVVVTYGADGVTGHPDHIAVGGWTTKTFHRLVKKYPKAAPKRLYHRISPMKRRGLYNRSDLVYRGRLHNHCRWEKFPNARLTAHACHRSQKQATDYTQPRVFEAGLVDYYVRQYPVGTVVRSRPICSGILTMPMKPIYLELHNLPYASRTFLTERKLAHPVCAYSRPK